MEEQNQQTPVSQEEKDEMNRRAKHCLELIGEVLKNCNCNLKPFVTIKGDKMQSGLSCEAMPAKPLQVDPPLQGREIPEPHIGMTGGARAGGDEPYLEGNAA